MSNSINSSQFNQILSQKPSDAIFIDVRNKDEFDFVKIPNVQNIPLAEISSNIDKLKKFNKVYVHCNSGNRSKQACELLFSLGLPNVVNVSGGITEWQQQGFEVIKGKNVLPIMQQVQIVAGSLILIGVIGAFFNFYFIGISAFVGGGLLFAGLTGNCTMQKILMRMWWNK